MIPERLAQFRFRVPIEMRGRREDGYLVSLRLQIHTQLAHDLGGRHAVRGEYEGEDYYIRQSMPTAIRIDEMYVQSYFFHTFRFT